MEAALAVNRWAAVCTTNLRWNDIYGDYHDYGMADHMVLDEHGAIVSDEITMR